MKQECARKRPFPARTIQFLHVGLKATGVLAAFMGGVLEAHAQVDPNTQTTLDSRTIQLDFRNDFNASYDAYTSEPGKTKAVSGKDPLKNACSSDVQYLQGLWARYDPVEHPAVAVMFPNSKAKTLDEFKAETKGLGRDEAQRALTYALTKLKELELKGKVHIEKVGDHEGTSKNLKADAKLLATELQLQTNFCHPKAPPSFKATGVFNPTDESNVLKSYLNPHSDYSLGYGGAVQATTAGFRDYDLMGVSVQNTYARYDKYQTKNLDADILQAAYQFYLGASSYNYKDRGQEYGIAESQKDSNMPATGLITVSTLSVGFLDQASYFTPSHQESSNLFTPQAKLGIQNISLLGSDPDNVCDASLPDFRKRGFCNFADLSITAGQTESDKTTLENNNIAASITLTKRIDQTDWKIALQGTMTARDYTDVPGGRHDVLWQGGPSLSYAPLPTETSWGTSNLTFTLPVTFYNNESSIIKDSWQGFIVMPTLSFAFSPPPAMPK